MPERNDKRRQIDPDLDLSKLHDLLTWALNRYGQRLALVTSFQAEGMVILDIASSIGNRIRVLTIDPGRLNQETYELIDLVRKRYGILVEVYYPNPAELRPFVHREGINAFYRSPELRQRCCEIRKARPLVGALAGLDAWITGLRKDQSPGRRHIPLLETDHLHGGIVKLNPLADWTGDDVWAYIHQHDVPYNSLYLRGYTSIGCAPCTRPTGTGEHARAGRWWWETGGTKECGIHPHPGQGPGAAAE